MKPLKRIFDLKEWDINRIRRKPSYWSIMAYNEIREIVWKGITPRVRTPILICINRTTRLSKFSSKKYT